MRDLSLADLSPEKRALLEKRLRKASSATIVNPSGDVPKEGVPRPLSFGQEGLWFFDQLVPNSPLYNIPQALRLSGALNVEALRRALDRIVERHQILRTRFFASERQAGKQGGESTGESTQDLAPVQVVYPHTDFVLPIIDLSGFPETERQARVEQEMDEEAKRPFALSEDLMLRARLLKVGADEHILLLSVHHIAADVWSLGVFYRELNQLYEGACSGTSVALPQLPTQYAEWATLQKNAFSAAAAERAFAYWERELAGELPLSSAPTDRRRGASPTFRGCRELLSFPAPLLAALTDLSRREETTLFAVLAAAFQTLLYRYNGQEDIAIGSPIGARQQSQTEPLIGLFLNMVVLRTDLSGNPSFQELLRRTRNKVVGALAHSEAPLERLVEKFGSARHGGLNPFFQTVFQYLPTVPAPKLAGLITELLPMEPGTAKFDLTLTLAGGEQGITGDLEYNTDLFEKATIVRMLGHFRTLLEGIVANPAQKIGLLPLISKAENQQIVEWNQTGTPYPKTASIKELFERQAQTSPNSVALISEGLEMTYQALNAKANQLAHYLIKAGVGPDIPVGVCLDRSAGLVIALLGITKAGGAYVPLDPSYPEDRLAFMTRDTNPRVIITDSCYQQRHFANFQGKTLRMDVDGQALEYESLANPSNCVGSDNLAYIIYTSGSTGTPKGVLVPQRGVVRLVKEANYVQFSPDDVFLLFAPVSFDASTFEIWGSLLNGAKLVIFPPQFESLQQLATSLARYKVTTLWLTAGLFHQMVEEHLDSLKGVRKLLAGGDVLSVPHVLKALAHLPNTQLINGYGPTENTTFTCCYSVPRNWSGETSVPIGRPISNTQVYIFDAFGQPTPIGVAGELFIAGDGLARGYLNAPQLTTEKFVPNHFCPNSGPTLYRTGDLVRWLPDGNIEFLGRKDHQVKIRGFRVEPGELEHSLAQHPSVQEAVVLARPDSTGNKQLIAYVTAKAETEIKISELRDYVERKLPRYMAPSHIIVMPEFPLTQNGKIARNLLPAPQTTRQNGPVAPRNPEEAALVEIWKEVLGRSDIGIEDSFFELGGHSLMATRVISRLSKLTKTEIPLREIFEHPTIAGLIRVVANRRNAGFSSPVAHRRASKRPIPVSFAQQRLWFLDQLQPNSPFYNIALSIRIKGELQVPVLQAVLNEIVRRHQALRTNFLEHSGQPMQVIGSPRPVDLPVVDARECAGDAARLKKLAEEELFRPFNLRTDLLFRARLLRLGELEHLLLLTVHHIVSDGWSMDVLFQECGAFYKAFLNGEPSPLPELPIHYGDFALWQRNWLSGEILQKQLDYWRKQLRDASPLELPTDKPRPTTQTFRGAVVSRTVSSALREQLETLSRTEEATLFMSLLCAFQALMQRYSGQDDIVIGTPISGRNRVELEDLIGFFVNTLVIRTDLSGEPTFRDLLRRTRESVLGAYASQDVPFEKVVEELHPERISSYNPFCRVLFTLQRAPSKPLQLEGLQLTHEPVSATTSKFDLTLYVIENAETGPSAAGVSGLSLVAEYSTDLFEAATVERMLDHYLALLNTIAANPEKRVIEASILSKAERDTILIDWNRTEAEYPKDKSLSALFEERVQARAKATAVIYGKDSLTYSELNTRANQAAHALKALGVGSETMVGVSLERSPEMIAVMLGIIKLGAAYVPLDQSYPRERLAFMAQDTQMPVIVTDRKHVSEMPGGPRVICADSLFKGAEHNPDCVKSSENLAYVIYTSGSTGKPKGVCVTQRSILRLVLNTNYVQIQPEDRIAQASNSSFDAATFEIWGALLNGATLVGVDKDIALSPCDLVTEIQQQRITTLFLTTALFNQIASEIPDAFCTLKHLLFGGEAVDPKWVREVLKHRPPERLLHVYGPTETTTFASWYLVRDVAEDARTVPIGFPIANTRFYVLDRRLQPVPVGVAGELYIGGDGVARGYWNRPELTEARFVPNPFDPNSGRLYRTGDLVRWLPEGSIEFVARVDQQVKIRGFRIELEEIEVVLGSHPQIKQSAVVVREDNPGDKRLVAYVTRKPEDKVANGETAENLSVDQVAHWQSIFDDHVYQQFEQLSDPTFNIKGWISSYSGEPIPAPEMSEWLEDTVSRILQERPGRVLEMGCGTGLLLFRIARECKEYVGADLSRVALDYVQSHLKGCSLNNVRLLQRTAEDFSGFDANAFDAVVFNSVVQYFPDINYLVRVIEQAVRCVQPGGFIFLGDIRSYPLMESFHASVQFQKAEDTLPLAQLSRRIQTQLSNERELLVHPELFSALASHFEKIGSVEVIPKRGKSHNELTRFRYQVVLRVGPRKDRGSDACGDSQAQQAEWLNWDDSKIDLGFLRTKLTKERPPLLGVRNIPNARLRTENLLLETLSKHAAGTVGELRAKLHCHASNMIDPGILTDEANKMGYEAQCSWLTHGPEGRFDVLLRRCDVTPDTLAIWTAVSSPANRLKPWHVYGNNPLQAEFARQLAPQLRVFLQDRLPDYMVPSSFVVLDSFPLTPNGKVDRRALPAPDNSGPGGEAYIAPRGELEKRLQGIWEDVLGRKAIGVHDNFFDLGGHSLLAVKLFAQVEKLLGKKIPLSSLFQAPTIEKLATLIREGGWAEPGSSLVEIQPLGSRAPIFWLHTLGGGGGGGLFTYQKLAELLGPDQPSYGLVAPPQPYTTIESMAEHYLKEVRRVQEKGPYYFGGYCFGGIIAFEMARQLEKTGEQTALLALLDSVPPNVPGDERLINSEFVANFVTNLPLWFGDLLQENPTQLRWRLERKTRSWLRRAKSWLLPAQEAPQSAAPREVYLEDIIDMSHYPPDFKRYAHIHWKALVQYVPGQYGGRVHLFRTRKPYRIGLNPESLWNKLAKGGVELRMIPGRHENILERPYVEVLARELTLCVEALQDEGADASRSA